MEHHRQEVRSVYFQFLGLGVVLLALCWMFALLQSDDHRAVHSRDNAADHWVMS
ncbi:MAG: hypothetical protein JSU88_03020 [Nitrospinaceae bacterium]|jgi:hypothetical protein|nr:MAG: hypothetical protein JSU88_03020 [Nitrospinaceae bacterium]